MHGACCGTDGDLQAAQNVQKDNVCGLATYIVFLGIVKAFDSVDHGALLYKLHPKGIRGRALRFIRALYESPTYRVLV